MTNLTNLRGGHVQLEVRKDGKVVWVNYNGVCIARVQEPDSVTVNDPGKQLKNGEE